MLRGGKEEGENALKEKKIWRKKCMEDKRIDFPRFEAFEPGAIELDQNVNFLR